MSGSSVFQSALRRFLIAAIIIGLAVATFGSSLQPVPPAPPVIIEHGPDETPLAWLSVRDSDDDRSELDHPMSDQEVSARSIRAVEAIAPAVVTVVRSNASGEIEAIGSGVVIDGAGRALASLGTTGADGRIAVVWPDGASSDARIERIDERYGVVLLSTGRLPAVVAPLAGYAPRSGDRILAIGSPLDDFTGTVTGGVIGALGIPFPESPDHPAIPDLIQHDAAINAGNEVGPIIDLNGNVVGITVGSIVRQGDELVQGLGFAVPIRVLTDLLTIPD